MEPTKTTQRAPKTFGKQARAAADELRVRAHLGMMDLKTQAKELEPRLEEAEQYLEEFRKASAVAVREMGKHLRALRTRLTVIHRNANARR